MKKISVLSEKDILNLLEIPDFRHLSKDKIMTFASTLPYMDSETAQKAIEQFPYYAEAVKGALGDMKDLINHGLQSNSESINNYYKIAQANICILQRELDKNTLSLEERKELFASLIQIQELIGQKDTENKKFIQNIMLISGAIIVVGLGVASSVLGLNTTLGISKKSA